MMSSEVIGVLIFLLVVATGMGVLAGAILDRELSQYNDTIAEYMMCIEYSPDCECSDIILSEYGEEAE